MGSVSRAMTKKSQVVQDAQDAMKRRAQQKRSWLPSFEFSSKTLIAAFACALVATLLSLWSSHPSLTGGSTPGFKTPPGAETLSKQITVNRSAAMVFDYVRTPSTLFEWQRHTRQIHGAIDRSLAPGMRFEQRSRFAGVVRDVFWGVQSASMLAGGTKMSLELTGNLTVSNSNQTENLWSVYTVEGLPSSRCTLRHQIYFKNTDFSPEEKRSRKAAIDVEMRDALELLRFNFHAKQISSN